MYTYRLLKRLRLPRFESVYVFHYAERKRSGKIGKGQDFVIRMRQVKESIERETGEKIKMNCALAVPVLFSGLSEKAVHRFLNWAALYPKDTKACGSGRTEWWKFRNYLSCALVLLILGLCGVQGKGWFLLAVIVLFYDWPLDFALFVLVLALLQYAVIGGAVWCLFNFLVF